MLETLAGVHTAGSAGADHIFSAGIRAAAVVDLAAIRDNVAVLRERTSADLMAVVKADGYGHGAVASAEAALAGGATRLATAYADEALALRAAGIQAPLLALITMPGEPLLVAALAAGIEVSVGCTATLGEIAAAAAVAGRPALVHLEVDTGLSRGGAGADAWAALLGAAARAQAAGAVDIVGIWSHLACSDRPDHPANAAQLAAYADALQTARRAGITPRLRHLANSGGLLGLPASHYDAVRPGIAVYGLSPGAGVDATGLRPAMTLMARLALTKSVPAGSGVSYGQTYVTGRPTRLGVVPLGYADGIPRHASNLAQVQVAGSRRPVAGRVCMDQFVVDLGDADARDGDPVVLFGPGTDGEPTAEQWAEAAGTIGYEIVTGIGPRVPRIHLGAGAM